MDVSCGYAHALGAEFSTLKIFDDQTFLYAGRRDLLGPTVFGASHFEAKGGVTILQGKPLIMQLTGTESATISTNLSSSTYDGDAMQKVFSLRQGQLVSDDSYPIVCSKAE